MARGGYRQPSQPAAVSGPGALSQRTDGQPIQEMTGGDYGEGNEMRTLQQSAPLAKAQPVGGGGGGAPADPLAAVTGFDAPTQMPEVPVTSGAAMGAGPDASAIGMAADPLAADRADVAEIKNMLPALIAAAQSDSATTEFKRYVRQLITLT